MYREMKQKSRN